MLTLILLASMAVIGWFGIRLFHALIIEKADAIQEYYATRENRERQIERLPELEKQFQSITENKEVLAILLSEERIVDFVQTLEKLAQETGTHVTIRAKNTDIIEEKKPSKAVVKKSEEESSSDTKKINEATTILDTVPFNRFLHVEVVVKGEYRTIVSFLHKMESLSLGIDVIGMSIKEREAEEGGVVRPSPGRNPFLIFAGDEGASVTTDQSEEVYPGTLEASFDTLVYLKSK